MKGRLYEFQSRLSVVHHRICEGLQALATGGEVDLSELSEEVERVCESVQIEFTHSEISETDRTTLAQKLNTIIRDLDKLNEELIKHHASKGGKIDIERRETD